MKDFECNLCDYAWNKEDYKDYDVSFVNNTPYLYNKGEACPECGEIQKEKSMMEGLHDLINLSHWAYLGHNKHESNNH